MVWLTLALLIHSLLFLIPVRAPQPATGQATVLSVELRPFLPRTHSEKPSELPSDSTTSIPAIEESDLQNLQRFDAKPGKTETTALSIVQEAKKTSDSPESAVQLYQLLRDSILESEPEDKVRRLGIPELRKQGADYNANRLSAGNIFDGMYAPARVEIEDRWLAADGSHNVVVNLPDGSTMCGRAAAWNPLQPLVEHVMMFRNCGGGGKRSFTMKSPYSHR